MKSPSNILGKVEALLKLLSTVVYFFTNDSPSKTMESFLFHLKAVFLAIFKLLLFFLFLSALLRFNDVMNELACIN